MAGPHGRIDGSRPSHPHRLSDFTATYGGFQFGFGAFLLACTHEVAWVEPGLWAATAALAGFASVRGLALLWSRARVRRSIWFGLGLELVGVALNTWALGRCVDGVSAASPAHAADGPVRRKVPLGRSVLK